MLALIPGAWYLIYSCKSCHTRQILFPDLTRGKSKLLATYLVVCPSCLGKAAYDAEEIERYHHPLHAPVKFLRQRPALRIPGESTGDRRHV
jgi:hypothetical protein